MPDFRAAPLLGRRSFGYYERIRPGARYSMHVYGFLIIFAIIVLSIFIARRAIGSFVSVARFLIPAIRSGWKRVRYGRVSRQGASGRQFEPGTGDDPHSWPSSR